MRIETAYFINESIKIGKLCGSIYVHEVRIRDSNIAYSINIKNIQNCNQEFGNLQSEIIVKSIGIET